MKKNTRAALSAFFLAAAALAWAQTSEAQAPTCDGAASLTWTPPTKNTDGSDLTNLAGYRVYWGTSRGAYTNQVTIANPGIAAYVVQQLCAATYFFAVAAYNSAATESMLSNEATKIVGGGSGGGGGATTPSAPRATAPVTVGGTARALATTKNAIVDLEVGTVAAGVPCDERYQFAYEGFAYMLVPVERVTPLPGVELEATFAVCR